MKKRLPILLLGLLAAGAGVFYYNRLHHSDRLTFTGFVEGEEKVIKSEIAGRVETVKSARPGARYVPSAVARSQGEPG